MKILAAIARFLGAVGLVSGLLVPFAYAAFELEPNDTAVDANTLTSGGVVTGQTSSSSDEDWYKVTAAGAGTISANLTGSPNASGEGWSLTIKDSTGNVLASTTCTAAGSPRSFSCPALITGISSGGDYFIVVSSPSSFALTTNDYSLTATAPPTVPPTPTCTLTASPNTITAGGSSTLAATCTPAAASYAWTNTGFASSASGGTVSPTTTTIYTVVGSNGAGAGNPATATVTVNPTAPTCTLTASPDTISAGGSSTLAAACSPAATSYAWTNTTFTTSSGTVSPTVTTTYSVVGSNAGGAGNIASATVTVTPPPPPPPPTPPTCGLTASPSTITGGGSSFLTASCNPAADSYAWTNTGFAATVSGGTVTPTVTTTYSVVGSNTGGAGASVSVTVAVTPNCTLTASPSTVTPGSSSTLTATCIPAATSYAWTNTDFGPTVNIGNVSPAVSTTYSVTGSNADGAGNSASAAVSVTTCTYSISPTSVSVPLIITNGTLSVTSAPACAWTAVSNVNWITMPFNTSGSGNGTVFYSVAANTPPITNGSPRTGTLTVAGQTFTVMQDGMAVPNCTLTASASAINLGGSVILTATCSPAATSYAWTPATGLVAGPANTAAVTPTAAGVYQYSVTGSNAGGAGNTPGTLVTVAPAPFISQSDCLFNWAERTYPDLFAPAGAISNTSAPYYYRFYPQTNAYLGTSPADSHVYYLSLSNNSILDVGALSGWLSTAGCQ